MAADDNTAKAKREQDERAWVIYILRCPDTLRVRYVGWTVNLTNRMAVHRYRAKKKLRHTYCERWIGKLLRQDKAPLSEVVEYGSGLWEARERFWIKHFREAGEPLTNLTEGGEGCLGVVPDEETRRKISAANKGKKVSEEVREHLRQVLKGRKFSEETRRKISATKKERKGTRGTNLSQEHKDKIRKGVKGLKRPFKKRPPMSQETRWKISQAHLDRADAVRFAREQAKLEAEKKKQPPP